MLGMDEATDFARSRFLSAMAMRMLGVPQNMECRMMDRDSEVPSAREHFNDCAAYTACAT